LEITIFSSANSTVYKDGGKITIQSLLQNRSDKYDIYFFIYNYVHGFNEHLLNLRKYISPEIIKLYDSDLFRRTCIIDDRLISFVNTLYKLYIYI